MNKPECQSCLQWGSVHRIENDDEDYMCGKDYWFCGMCDCPFSDTEAEMQPKEDSERTKERRILIDKQMAKAREHVDIDGTLPW